MKKNKMMRIASVLLVAVILTTCAISGTFAKYVTDKTASDTARVAKFGVKIIANGSTFAEEYDTDDINVVGTIAKSVVSTAATDPNQEDNVVAPGTNGDLANATITGTPEVAVNVKHEATLTVTGWKLSDNTTEYFPIVFTVDSETYAISGMKDSAGNVATHDYDTIANLVAAVEAAIEDNSANYGAGTDLSGIHSTGGYVDVSWEWAFTGNDDVKDTYLGDQAATATASTISLAVTTTVTQID